MRVFFVVFRGGLVFRKGDRAGFGENVFRFFFDVFRSRGYFLIRG